MGGFTIVLNRIIGEEEGEYQQNVTQNAGRFSDNHRYQ
jgi:hypothetical protein